IRADDPTGRNDRSVDLYALAPDAADRNSPEHLHAFGLGVFDHRPVQYGPAHPESRAVWEAAVNHVPAGHHANAAEGESLSGWKLHTEVGQSRETVGHQPFAAGFIDGWKQRVGQHDAEPPPACRNRGSQARGPTPDHEYVSHWL